ncbi:hypothetical protein V8F20_004922 [Naviculisporaceae sp. PSN 640]
MDAARAAIFQELNAKQILETQLEVTLPDWYLGKMITYPGPDPTAVCTHFPQRNRVEEAPPATTVSRSGTGSKKGRQVKAQFRALFNKRLSILEVDQAKDDTQSRASTTSTFVDSKINEVVVGDEPINRSIDKDVTNSERDVIRKTNIIVSTISTATVTSSLDASHATPTVRSKPPPRPISIAQPLQPLLTTSSSTQHLRRTSPNSTSNEKQNAAHLAEIATLRQTLNKTLAHSQTLESRLAKAELQTHKLTRKSEILTSALARANTDSECAREKLQKTIDGLIAENDRLSELEMELMKEQARVRGLKHRLDNKEREVEELDSRLGRVEGRCSVLSGQVSRLREERDRVRLENERLWAILGFNGLNMNVGGSGGGERNGAGLGGRNYVGDIEGRDSQASNHLAGEEEVGRENGDEVEDDNLSGMTEVDRDELRRWI